MRPLGYVLLVINLLVAGGFVYLAIQDWKGRQEITGSGLRHILILRGVPYDGPEDMTTDPEAAIPFFVEMAGGQPTTTVSPKLLETYFAGAPVGDSKSPFAAAAAVPSQKAELKRVRQLIKKGYDDSPADQKLRLLEGWLQYQTETYAERAAVQRAGDEIRWCTEAVALRRQLDGPQGKNIPRDDRQRLRERELQSLIQGGPVLTPAQLQYLIDTDAPALSAAQLAARITDNLNRLAVILDLKFHQINPGLIAATGGPLAPEAWDSLASRTAELEAGAAKTREEAVELDKQAAADLTRAANATADLAAVVKGGKPTRVVLKGNRGKGPLTPEQELREVSAGAALDASAKRREAVRKQMRADEMTAEAGLLRPPPAAGEAELRMRLAHLLVHLDTDAVWQKRVILVVGLRQYVKTVGSQTLRFLQMAEHVDKLIWQEQREYDTELAQLRQLAIQRTQMVMDITAVRTQLVEQRDKDKEFVKQRQTQLADLTQQLATIRADVDSLVAEQAGIERELFTLQRDIAVTLDDVYELQDKLRDAESKRFGVP